MKSLAGIIAFCGVWFCFVVVIDHLIIIETNGVAMAYGVLAFAIGRTIQRWITGSKLWVGGF